MKPQIKIKRPVVATELRFEGSSEMAVGRDGHLNASNKRDLINQQLKLLQASANGDVISEEHARARQEMAADHRKAVEAAFNDERSHKEVGEMIADNLYMTANRKGFLRKYMARIELQQGQIPRFPVRGKNVTSIQMTSPTELESQIVRDKYLTPPEFQIAGRIFIPQNELNQSNGDVLEEKYIEALESVMVTEDRLWYNMANGLVGVDNNLTNVSGTLNPLLLMTVRNNVARWGLKVAGLLMASDLYIDIVGDSSFIQAIEPVSRHELIMTGELAVLYGMPITSDAYRHPEHRVLGQGEFFAISDPQTHGAFSDRGGIDSSPIDGVVEKKAGKGWWFFESFALAIANSRSVAKGYRV